MPAGRPPKPTSLKLLHGNPGKRPINEAEPAFPIDDSAPPRWLNAVAKREWNRLIPTLHQQGLFTVGDVAEYAGYCNAYAEVQYLTRFLRRKGRTFETVNGYIGARPEVSMLERAWARMHTFASVFGFSPAARTRIKAAPEKAADPFEDFLAGGRSS